MSNRSYQRASQLAGHITGDPSTRLGARATGAGADDDVVIVSAVRTAIGRARKGSFKDTHPGELLSAALRGVVEKVKCDPKHVQDIQVGNVLAPGCFAVQGRMSQFLAGFDEKCAISTVNRQCSSGLQAVAGIASAIQSGFIDVGIAAGVESMTNADMAGSVGEINEKAFDNDLARACLNPMGTTSEAVAEKFGITREQQDQMAVASHERALRAQAEGRFANEIVPVTTIITDKEGNEKEITVTKDDGPRKGTTLAKLAKLRAAFQEDGTTTAGNSSQVSDGAAAVLLMRRSKAKELGLPVLAKFVTFAAVGVPPEIMGIGPAVAIPAALKKAGLKSGDVDVYEINEAFASQATYCVKELGLPMDKVNPNGGAIALGHPLGCTGARMVATLVNELHRTKGNYGVVSMCIGTGMGACGVFQRQ